MKFNQSMASISSNNMTSAAQRLWLPISLIVVTTLLFFGQQRGLSTEGFPAPKLKSWEQNENSIKPESPVWISMAVCWSGNTNFHHKEHFPYADATKLSTSLWNIKTTHRTIVYVVYDEKDRSDPNLERYATELRQIGNHVELVPTTSSMECSLKAQLQRMFAFQLPYIGGKDIIITSDVDTFVMDKDIFSPLQEPGYEAWIFQYDDTLANEFTFNMNFIAMSSDHWRGLFDGIDTAEQLVQHYTDKIKLENFSKWDYDQLIITRMILEQRLCTLPSTNTLWRRLGLEPPTSSDADRCYRGEGQWRDCNIKRRTIPTGCKRWHFHPHERARDLQRAYDKIYMAAKKSILKRS